MPRRLRKQWGFDGYVVSDCEAIRNIWSPQDHHYVKTAEEAAAAAVKAGCNLCCGRDYNALVKAVQQGLIAESEIDQALYHTIWTRFRLGLFDPPDRCPYAGIGMDQNDTPGHRRLALQVARESLVLLKNTGSFPLDRDRIKRIAVIGPNGNSTSMCGSARVHLDRGESRRVTVEVPAERLRCWDADGKQYVVEPGRYEFLIGDASDDARLILPATVAAQ